METIINGDFISEFKAREHSTLEQIIRNGDIEELVSQAEFFASQLRYLHHQVMRNQKKFGKYKIEDYWDSKQIGDLKRFLVEIHYGDSESIEVHCAQEAQDGMLRAAGEQVPERGIVPTSLKNAVFSGVLYKGREIPYIFSQESLKESLYPIGMLVPTLGIMGSGVGGLNEMLNHSPMLLNAILLGGGIGAGIGLAFSIPMAMSYVLGGTKDPFRTLASGIKDKTYSLKKEIEEMRPHGSSLLTSQQAAGY